VSVITEAELRTGAAKSSSPIKTLRLVENFSTPARHPLDTLIAGQAVARKLTLVSNNEREFRRVHGLRVENWTR
jgi:predicted nucleic acid-binding protein